MEDSVARGGQRSSREPREIEESYPIHNLRGTVELTRYEQNNKHHFLEKNDTPILNSLQAKNSLEQKLIMRQ